MLRQWLLDSQASMALLRWLGQRVGLVLLAVIGGVGLLASPTNEASLPQEPNPFFSYPETDLYKLTASDGATGDGFGSVAICGDTAIIGAKRDDDNGTDSGSAYIFVHEGSAWNQRAKLTATDGAALDEFGHSVAVSGDTVVVSSHGDDDSGDSSGSAYIFVWDGIAWTQQAKLVAGDAAALDAFGFAAISADTVIVGAHNDDDKGESSGSAYIFVQEGTTWTQQAKLTASDGATGDHFGWSVAISGDTAIVGALDDDDNGESSGSAYVFVREGTSWSQQAKLWAADGAAHDEFGRAVAISGDTAIAGAYGDDDGGSNSGSAYVFVREGLTWSQQEKLTASDAAVNDALGYSVAVDGGALVVGAYGDDSKGSAYIFVREGGFWIEQVKLISDDGVSGDAFGLSSAISGDLAIIGAPYDNELTGSAYVHDQGDSPCAVPITGVEVTGLTTGYTHIPCPLGAVVTPLDATEPITYTWSPEPDSGQGTATAWYEWDQPGTYSITLEAENCGGVVSDTHTMSISVRVWIYLPMVLRGYSPPAPTHTPTPTTTPTATSTVTPTPTPTSTPTPTQPPQADLYIHSLIYDSSDERLVIKNRGTGAQDMTGWKVHSVVGDQWFYFPSGHTLNAEASVYVHSGPDGYSNPPTHLLWNHTYIWNNDGDKAILYNSANQRIDSYCYKAGCP